MDFARVRDQAQGNSMLISAAQPHSFGPIMNQQIPTRDFEKKESIPDAVASLGVFSSERAFHLLSYSFVNLSTTPNWPQTDRIRP
jgi:hypothetical protein